MEYCMYFSFFKPQDWRKRSVVRGRGFIQRFLRNRRIDDDPESSLIFCLNRQPDRAVSACDPTADADKDRCVRDTDYRLRNCRLWC